MPKLVWDQTGEKQYETGVKNGVLYPQENGTYPKGVAWNGLTAVNESPSGADETKLYADDVKYLSLRAAEEYGATIEAYMSPVEFDACDGTVEVAKGVTIGQQTRQAFGFAFTTTIGNDTEGESFGYVIHLIYNATASPSSKDHSTINDSPEATTLSWEISTTPISVSGHKPTSTIEIDSTRVDADKLKELETILYGSDSAEARLPLPDEIIELLGAAA